MPRLTLTDFQFDNLKQKPNEFGIINEVTIEDFRSLLRYCAITYPTHILKRRLKLLTKNERLRFDAKWCKVVNLLEEMEKIVALRAEYEEDEWK
jgi:hypothetical protein